MHACIIRGYPDILRGSTQLGPHKNDSEKNVKVEIHLRPTGRERRWDGILTQLQHSEKTEKDDAEMVSKSARLIRVKNGSKGSKRTRVDGGRLKRSRSKRLVVGGQ